jgi:hypothetical protein
MEERIRMRMKVLLEYTDVFSPTVPGVEYVTQLKHDADLSKLNMKSFRKSPKELATEREAMERFLERVIVRPSASWYGTNNVFVEKWRHPDGTSAGIRVTADMRAVNSESEGDAFPTDDVKAIVFWMASKKWFLVMDLCDGYWNIALSEESRKFTEIKLRSAWWSTRGWRWDWRTQAAFFQRVVNDKYRGLKGDILDACQDDISVGIETAGKHVEDVRSTLQRTREARLRMRLQKCAFGKVVVTVLGGSLSVSGGDPSRRGTPKCDGQLSGTEEWHRFDPVTRSVECFWRVHRGKWDTDGAVERRTDRNGVE